MSESPHANYIDSKLKVENELSVEIPVFSQQDEQFIKSYFDSFTLHVPPEGEVREGQFTIRVLSNRGSSPTYLFMNAEEGLSHVIKRAEREVSKYKSLPEYVRKAIFLNPITRVASDQTFYSTPLITGVEGASIRDVLSMEAYVDKAVELVVSTSELKVQLQDINLFSGRNLFWGFKLGDASEQQDNLYLFDHGSYEYLDAALPDLLAYDMLGEVTIDLLGPFYAAILNDYMLSENHLGEIQLSEMYVDKIQFVVAFIKLICERKNWASFPFYKLKFIPSVLTSSEIKAARTEKIRVECPIPENSRDIIQLICEAVAEYKGVRNVVVKELDGEMSGAKTISRAAAVKILQESVL